MTVPIYLSPFTRIVDIYLYILYIVHVTEMVTTSEFSAVHSRKEKSVKIVLSYNNYTALQIAEQAVRSVINKNKRPIFQQCTIRTIERNGQIAYDIRFGVQVFWKTNHYRGNDWVDIHVMLPSQLPMESEGVVWVAFPKERIQSSQTGIVSLDYLCPEHTHFKLSVCSQSRGHVRQLNKSFCY